MRTLLIGTAAEAMCLLACACGSGVDPDDASISTVTADATSPTFAVTLSDSGCTPDSFTLKPGITVFTVTNPRSNLVKEMEIQDDQGHVRGDAEGVAPGTTKSFVVDLKAGTYRVRCPQTATSGGTITVG